MEVLACEGMPVPFTWENHENEVENLLEIEIEGIKREYNLD